MKRRIFNITTILVLSLTMLIGMTTMAFATQVQSGLSSTQIEWLKSNVEVSNGRVSAPDVNVRGKLLTSPPANGNYSMLVLSSGSTIYWTSANDVSLGTSINRAINNDAATDKMQGLTDELNITADTQGAGIMLAGLAPIINLVLGIIVTLIMFGMAISSSFDVCYIAFPVFRNKCEDAKTSGNAMMTKKSSNGDTSLRWVTDDAQYAVNSTVTEGNGRSPWTMYFKKRVGSYIFLTIIMFILLTGNITLITDIALKAVGGILDVLQGLA